MPWAAWRVASRRAAVRPAVMGEEAASPCFLGGSTDAIARAAGAVARSWNALAAGRWPGEAIASSEDAIDVGHCAIAGSSPPSRVFTPHVHHHHARALKSSRRACDCEHAPAPLPSAPIAAAPVELVVVAETASRRTQPWPPAPDPGLARDTAAGARQQRRPHRNPM